MKLRSERLILFSTAVVLIMLALVTVPRSCAGQQSGEETIVMIRHGEKPAGGLGQLNCMGLNRALALPDILLGRYGNPDFIYAPNPAVQIRQNYILYSYVRPLMTIEPTAIRVGLPVNTQIGYNQIGELQKELTQPEYAHARIFVAWEHGYLNNFARQFLKSYGENPSVVPDWSTNDYDTIYVFRLTRQAGKAHLAFSLEHEGLDGTLSKTCPLAQH